MHTPAPHRSQLRHSPTEARAAILLLHPPLCLIIFTIAATQLAFQPLRLRL